MKRIGQRICLLIFVIASNVAHASEVLKVLLIGDSIASGYGLPPEAQFAPVLASKLDALGTSIQFTNYAVAGATTQFALGQIGGIDARDFDAVVIELGANDILRGVNPQKTKDNLSEIIRAFDQPIYLIGMRAPQQYGSGYVDAFDAIYVELAQTFDSGLYPFLFEPIFAVDQSTRSSFFQNDGIHLNAKGVDLVTHEIAADLVDWLEVVNLLHP